VTSGADSIRYRFRYHTVIDRAQGFRASHPHSGPVVVGVDGSPAANTALNFGAELAGAMDVEVIAVHALRIASEFMLDIPPMGLTAWREQLEKRLTREWCAPLRDAGLPYRAMYIERPVASALLGVSEREHASRLVVGVPHHGSFTHFGRGTLPERLTRRAPCPVIAVPARHASAATMAPTSFRTTAVSPEAAAVVPEAAAVTREAGPSGHQAVDG
jgi:nucleotide-binding universal stress UspA family protein